MDYGKLRKCMASQDPGFLSFKQTGSPTPIVELIAVKQVEEQNLVDVFFCFDDDATVKATVVLVEGVPRSCNHLFSCALHNAKKDGISINDVAMNRVLPSDVFPRQLFCRVAPRDVSEDEVCT